MTHEVHAMACDLWDARRDRRGFLPAMELSRRLAVVIARDVAEHADYDPELDVRVMWLRQIIDLVRKGQRNPRLDSSTEFCMEWLLDKYQLEPCGKERAAGVA